MTSHRMQEQNDEPNSCIRIEHNKLSYECLSKFYLKKTPEIRSLTKKLEKEQRRYCSVTGFDKTSASEMDWTHSAHAQTQSRQFN